MGLEALSRGAAEATFVERDREALKVLKRNIETVGLGGTVVAGDVDRFLDRSRSRYDLAFVDPPYAVTLASLVETVSRLSTLMAPDALVVVHRRSGETPPTGIGALTLVDERKFGGAVLWRFAKEDM